MPARDIGYIIDQMQTHLVDREIIRMVETSAEKVGLRAVRYLKEEYPPPPPDDSSPSPIHTEKQRRWWWAQMSAKARGEAGPESLRGWKAVYRTIQGVKTLVLSGGYKRTGTMVRSITHNVVPLMGLGVELQIGPSMAHSEEGGYAQLVIGLPPPAGQQAKIHQDRWKPMVLVIEAHEDELFTLFFDDLWKQFENYWRR